MHFLLSALAEPDVPPLYWTVGLENTEARVLKPVFW